MTSSRSPIQEKQLEALKSFLDKKKVLIAIANSQVRAMVRGVLSTLGTPGPDIFSTKSFKEATELMESQSPDIIFTEFEFDSHFGIELSILQKDYCADLGQRLFFLFADSGLESNVAAAAEEEVDAYLIRPISEQAFQEYLAKAVHLKLNPSELSKIISSVRQLIAAKELDRAQTTLAFSQMTLPAHPAINFYLGYVAQLMGKHKDALRNFEEGLAINPRHFKCMYGKFMSLYYLGRKNDAYRYVGELKQIYPLTPELLKYAFVVVVETYNFDEVENYYQIYLKLVRKPESLKLIVSTALLTCGRVMLRKDKADVNRVLNCFVKGAVISGRQVEFIEGIIKELIEYNLTEHINQFFDMFKEEEISLKLVRSLRFKQWVSEKRDPHFLLNEGKRMIFENHADDFVIQYSLSLAKSLDKMALVQSLVVRLMENFPDRRQEFADHLSEA